MKSPRISPPSQRLGAYLSLGLGAGVLGSQTAAGQIVYSNISPITITPGETVWFQPTTGGVAISGSDPFASGAAGGLDFNGPHYIYTQNNNLDFAVTGEGTTVTSRLTLGASIGTGLAWHSGAWTYLDRHSASGYPWAATGSDGTNGYIGLRFGGSNPDGSDSYYGWAAVTYNVASQTLTLNGFAYDETRGETIGAGSESAVPEPVNTTLFFALGAAGLVALRRMRNARARIAG